MDDFLWRAGLAGIGMALIAAPLGCFVVWQRMAYFGETIAHAGLLGVALGLLAHIHISLAIFATSLVVAFGLKAIERSTLLAKDTALGLIAHVMLALGLIVASQFEALQLDLMGLLFGDILATSLSDLWLVLFGLVFVWGLIYFIWQDLLLLSIDGEMAMAEGVPVRRVSFLLSLAIAATVALSMKLVGLLLVTAMLIIPAASALNFARSPEQMAAFSALISVFSVVVGLLLSLYVDVPSGPAIVVVMGASFLTSALLKRA